MENILLKYMIERFNEEKHIKDSSCYPNPFITISREYGCPAKEIAALLIHKINLANANKIHFHQWELISKEILDEASKELNVHTDRILKFYSTENRSSIDEILISLSQKYYQSNLAIKKTLSKIIQDFALKGNVVIVGRGSVGVTNKIENGFHVRLTAPLEWRAQKIVEKGYCSSFDTAKKLANDIDNKRNDMLKIMSNNSFKDSFFDITYNCKFFNKEDISDSIIYHMSSKGLLKFR